MRDDLDVLRAFLSARVYRHPRVARIMGDAERIVARSLRPLHRRPERSAGRWREQAPRRDPRGYARHVCDFIAGMTDRYALAEHRRLFDATPDLR